MIEEGRVAGVSAEEMELIASNTEQMRELYSNALTCVI